MDKFEHVNETISDTERVYKLRDRILDLARLELQDTIYYFDQSLKKTLIEKYGSTTYLQQVAVWQALVGGTIEDKTTISEEIYKFITDQVMSFVTKLESELK